MHYSSFSSNRTEARLLEPYHLLFQGGAWYVVAYCHARGEIRTFRVDRMSDLAATGETFARAPGFNLNAYLGASWGIMRGESHDVAVKFFPPISRYICEGHWHSSQRIDHQEDGSVVFHATIDGLEEIKRWILSFGAGAQVIAPNELLSAVLADHRAAMERYDNVQTD